jgi:hypothetical protein
LFTEPKATIYGKSEPLENKTYIIVKPPYGTQDAPSQLIQILILFDYNKPENNGGNPIIG